MPYTAMLFGPICGAEHLACFRNRDVKNFLLERQCNAQNGAKSVALVIAMMRTWYLWTLIARDGVFWGIHRTLADWYVQYSSTQAEVLCLYKQGLPGLQLRFIYFCFSQLPPSICRQNRKLGINANTYSFLIGANISLFHPSMSATDQEGQLNMPPSNRSAWRDTAIYASDNRDKVLGGLCATEGITNENLYSMIEIFCFFTDTFTLHNNSGQLVERDGQKLQPGNYYITTNGNSFPTA